MRNDTKYVIVGIYKTEEGIIKQGYTCYGKDLSIEKDREYLMDIVWDYLEELGYTSKDDLPNEIELYTEVDYEFQQMLDEIEDTPMYRTLEELIEEYEKDMEMCEEGRCW